MKEGIIAFSGYCLEEMSYSKNNNYEEIHEYIDLSPQFLFNIIIKKDAPYKYNTLIGARVGFIDEEKSPFKAEVILRGFFEIKEGQYEEQTLQRLYIVNSSAILFPYLRSTLTDITSKSNHGPVVLPTFNFHTIVEDLNFKDLTLDSKEYKEATVHEI